MHPLARGEARLKALAEESFRQLAPAALREAVLSPGVRPEQLDAFARRSQDVSVLEPLIRHKAVPTQTLAWLADRIEPYLQDVLVTNQVRLLAAPVIVERLFENPHLSADIRRRADEFLEEFFLKKEREEDARAAAGAGAAEAGQDTVPAFPEVSPALAAEHAESEEVHQNLFMRLSGYSVAQKIRLAWRGSKEERLFLDRDQNRLVALAVLKSPKTREGDAETIANMKGLEMLRELRRLNEASHHGNLILKIGIHRGAAISVTLNERIDYFCQTVNIASRGQGSAGGDEIYLTEEIYSSPGVLDLLQKHGCKIESNLIELKGIEGQVKIYKVSGSNENTELTLNRLPGG